MLESSKLSGEKIKTASTSGLKSQNVRKSVIRVRFAGNMLGFKL
jgi:hypothetical protein